MCGCNRNGSIVVQLRQIRRQRSQEYRPAQRVSIASRGFRSQEVLRICVKALDIRDGDLQQLLGTAALGEFRSVEGVVELPRRLGSLQIDESKPSIDTGSWIQREVQKCVAPREAVVVDVRDKNLLCTLGRDVPDHDCCGAVKAANAL